MKRIAIYLTALSLLSYSFLSHAESCLATCCKDSTEMIQQVKDTGISISTTDGFHFTNLDSPTRDGGSCYAKVYYDYSDEHQFVCNVVWDIHNWRSTINCIDR